MPATARHRSGPARKPGHECAAAGPPPATTGARTQRPRTRRCRPDAPRPCPAEAKPEDTQRWTASQVVAHNLTRARELRSLTQTDIAERLTRFTGSNWSQATVAQAEGSVAGHRVRQFTANELVALARTFDLPVLFFFMPPDDGTGRLVTDDAKAGLPWEYLLLLVLGHRQSFPILADRAANWSHVLALRHRHPPLRRTA